VRQFWGKTERAFRGGAEHQVERKKEAFEVKSEPTNKQKGEKEKYGGALLRTTRRGRGKLR